MSVRSEPGVLVVEDVGAGLTRDEIVRFLATVGAGYTRTLRDAGKGDGLIGYFGLGFLSAFVVAEHTEVWTCSYQSPELAHRFTSKSGESYAIELADRRPVGTEVRLRLKPQFRELADPGVLRARLERYCCLLRFPVELAGHGVVNAEGVPWREAPRPVGARRRAQALALARRFEPNFEPLAALPVVDPVGRAEGVLWLQDAGSFATSDHRHVSVFVRGMLIGEEERELLPRWAGFVGALVECDALSPTASRETLQKDEEWKRVASLLTESLVSGLAGLAAAEPATWRRVLTRHAEALLGAALVDERLFELVADEVTVPTSDGDLRVSEIRARGRGKIYVSQGDRAGAEAILFRALRLPVVRGDRWAALPFVKRFAELRGGSVVLLGTERGDAELFAGAGLGAVEMREIEAIFAANDRQVLVRRFEPTSLPYVLVRDRDVELKRRIESDEADRRMGQAVLGLARAFTKQIEEKPVVRCYVNSASPVVQALPQASEKERARALALMAPLGALLAEGDAELDAEAALGAFSAALLEVVGKESGGAD